MATPRVLVGFDEVRAAYGTRALLDGVTLSVNAGNRIGVVGRNGAGKTTLLRLLSGTEQPHVGRVTRAGGVRVSALSQEDAAGPAAAGSTVRGLVTVGRLEHDWAGDPLVRSVLTGLLGGPTAPVLADGLDTALAGLSGGERRRASLAAVLTADSDLLLLDEPTNHLDVEAIDWLAKHLAQRTRGRTALVLVTHDRWFLDAVCTRTWELADGRVHGYEGGYAAYVLARAERARLAEAAEARRQNLLRKELAWLRRGPPARTSKPKFRIAAADALIAAEPPVRDRTELVRVAGARLGRKVLGLTGVSVSRGGRRLLAGVDWLVGPGDRIALVGVNGSGKTTLLRLLAGDLAPDAGTVETGPTVRLRYLSQDLVELDGSVPARDAVESVARVLALADGRELTAVQLLDRLGFDHDRQATPVSELSGGERRRLQILRLLMAGPNVLLLDEPTNDLDTETLAVLEDVLDGWAGSLVVVSHDRYFLERVCDSTVALLGDGTLGALAGGVEEYLARRRARAAAAGVAVGATRAGPVAAAGAASAKDQVPGPAVGEMRRTARRRLAKAERDLDRIARQESALHEELARHATDPDRVLALDTELRALVTQRSAVESEWLDAAELVDGG